MNDSPQGMNRDIELSGLESMVLTVLLIVMVLMLAFGVTWGSPANSAVTEAAPTLSEATLARWVAWMDDDRVPVFYFWRDPSSGKWVASSHTVKRVWSPQTYFWHESAFSLEAALLKVLDKMDGDQNLRR